MVDLFKTFFPIVLLSIGIALIVENNNNLDNILYGFVISIMGIVLIGKWWLKTPDEGDF